MLIKPTNPMIKIIKSSMGQHHIESKNQSSPKGMKPFDIGGVGLGIVAALENSSEDANNRIPVNNAAVLRRNLSRSKPIPVKNSSRVTMEIDNSSFDDDEEYTIVTFRDPKESYTKVYTNNGSEHRKIHHQSNFRVKNQSSLKTKRVGGVFHISPAKSWDLAAGVIPSTDFLSSCNICQKKLHGHDIYMYRGEKAFCSTECRYKQIVIDERKEKHCSTEASRQVQVDVSSSSPYANGHIFTTEILAS